MTHALPLLAMDRATVRRVDLDGHLHVERANISKANVCPYRGNEIPGWRQLGLDGQRVYMLLRDPDELARAAPSFAGKPVLDLHIPIGSRDHPHGQVVGAIGTDVQFDGTYLTAPLSVWEQDSIDRINDDTQRQLSPGYRYRPDMTPGNFNGVAYDGVMRDIVANHLALVREGRTGPDVVIGDTRLEMPKMLKSRRALMGSGAIAALVHSRMAADAKLDLESAFDGVTAENFVEQRDAIAAKVVEIVKPGLAADQSLEAAEVVLALDGVAATTPDDDDALPEPKAPERKTPVTPDGGGLPPTKKPPTQPSIPGAMDEATVTARIAEAAENARRSALTEAAAIRTAETEVRPVVGEVAAMDSAASVYRLALDHMKIDVTGVPESAYGAMFRAAQSQRSTPTDAPIAVDHAALAAGSKAFAERFPNRSKLVRV